MPKSNINDSEKLIQERICFLRHIKALSPALRRDQFWFHGKKMLSSLLWLHTCFCLLWMCWFVVFCDPPFVHIVLTKLMSAYLEIWEFLLIFAFWVGYHMISDARKEKRKMFRCLKKSAEVKTKSKAASEFKTFFLVMGMWCMLAWV